jgi:hypothetical protein
VTSLEFIGTLRTLSSFEEYLLPMDFSAMPSAFAAISFYFIIIFW